MFARVKIFALGSILSTQRTVPAQIFNVLTQKQAKSSAKNEYVDLQMNPTVFELS